MSGKNVFLIGPGFIGMPVIDLLIKEGYNVTTMSRRKEQRGFLEKMGAAVVEGTLSDSKTITQNTEKADIVIHAATADDLPSVQAVLDGVKKRASAGSSTIFIHTSGTSNLDDQSKGEFKGDKIYKDNEREAIDSLPASNPHRDVEMAVVDAAKEIGDKAKIAMMIPPQIYGYNEWNGRLTIQFPTLVRFAIKHGYSGVVGKGLSVMSSIHVNDLARGYMTLLHYLESNSADVVLKNPYFFCENGEEVSWKQAAEEIGKGLQSAGKIKSAEPQQIPESQYGDLFGPVTTNVVALNSRSRAVRLRELGWQPKEKGVYQSLHEDELPQILKEDCSKFAGYGGVAVGSN